MSQKDSLQRLYEDFMLHKRLWAAGVIKHIINDERDDALLAIVFQCDALAYAQAEHVLRHNQVGNAHENL